MIDVRDDALAALLDDSVRGVDPSPDERLTAIRRRGSARRAARWVGVVTALAVSLGAVAWAGLALRRETPSGTDTPPNQGAEASDTWRTDQDDWLGLSFRHPEAWPIGIVETTCRVTFQGVLISNHPLEFGPVALNGCVPLAVRLPDDLVIVAITRWEGGPVPSPSDRPDTTFPLSIDHFRSGLGFWTPSLTELGNLEVGTLPFQVSGDERFAVRLFTAEASEEDRAIAERIISSIGLIDPCESAPELGPGFLTCEEAIEGHRATRDARIIDARVGWYGKQRAWVFVTEPYRVYEATPSHPTPVCYEGAQEIVLIAQTGHLIAASGIPFGLCLTP